MMSMIRVAPTLNGLSNRSTRTSIKNPLSAKTLLLWVLLVLMIGFPSAQIHLSLTIPDDTTVIIVKESNHQTNYAITTNSKLNVVVDHSLAPEANPTSSSEGTTPLHFPNFTYEIFEAPSNIDKYASPIVPAAERQWLEAKRRKQGPPKQIIPFKLPLPIFVLNLPKSGTQSIYDYFAKCGSGNGGGIGKHWVAHYWIQRFQSKVGRCLADNVWNDRPMAQGCGEAKLSGYAIYTDAGLMWSEEGGIDNKNNQTLSSSSSTRKCFFPGVHGLENIAKYYPHATILHFPRNVTQWVESSSHWNHLLTRYDTFCGGLPEVMNVGSVHNATTTTTTTSPTEGEYQPKHPATTETEWMRWYHAYTQRIRDFVKHHSSLTYVESPLEDINGTAHYLQDLTGIPASCYGRSHVNEKRRTKQE
jgi:hypothetical protein